MKTREENWCGEGDLNPHEIAPASTSRYLTRFRGVPSNRISLILREVSCPGVSRIRTNTVAKPLTVAEHGKASTSGACTGTPAYFCHSLFSPRANRLDALLSAMPGCQLGRPQPVIRCLERQLEDRRHANE